MNRYLAPVALAAALSLSSAAIAAQHSSGAVRSYNAKGHTLTLEDGIAYQLPTKFKDPGLKEGVMVDVTWNMKNGKHLASAVTIQPSSQQ